MAVAKLRFKADDGNDYPEWNDFTKLEDISAFITKGATPTTYGFDWQPNGVYFFRNDCIKNNVLYMVIILLSLKKLINFYNAQKSQVEIL